MSGGSIGFLLHPRSHAVTEAAISRAREHGLTTWTATGDPVAAVAEHGPGTALLVTVGGDGTFLFGARLAAPLGIPVLGANRGRLGFLTDVEAADLPGAIDDFVAGRHTIEPRRLLAVRIEHAAGVVALEGPALNDVAVKSRGVGVARIRVEADGELLGDFDSDGVVVATATGSTAYAMSAGGPPVDPRIRALVVVPLAPHAVISRAVVIPDDLPLTVTVVRGRVFAATDGHDEVPLDDGARIRIAPGPQLGVVRLPDSPTFLRRLREKVRFGTPLRGALDDGSAPSVEDRASERTGSD
ncbi:MAG: NAD(+)/NADH kinase [Candidatus Dormibacteria bacterium]